MDLRPRLASANVLLDGEPYDELPLRVLELGGSVMSYQSALSARPEKNAFISSFVISTELYHNSFPCGRTRVRSQFHRQLVKDHALSSSAASAKEDRRGNHFFRRVDSRSTSVAAR